MDWVAVAQVASGIAALVAVLLSASTIKSARRVPLTDSYLDGWREILDATAIACEGRDAPPPVGEADAVMRQYRVADHRLSVLEATVRARIYGSSIRSDLNNLLLDVLYDNPDIRDPTGGRLTRAEMPKEEWADCCDDDWERVINSVPFSSMLISEVWDAPGRSATGSTLSLMRWYYPVVLRGLSQPAGWSTSPKTPAQRQLATFLDAYVNTFVLPWVRDASREVLMGRVGFSNRIYLIRETLGSITRSRRQSPPGGLTLFSSTQRR